MHFNESFVLFEVKTFVCHIVYNAFYKLLYNLGIHFVKLFEYSFIFPECGLSLSDAESSSKAKYTFL